MGAASGWITVYCESGPWDGRYFTWPASWTVVAHPSHPAGPEYYWIDHDLGIAWWHRPYTAEEPEDMPDA